MTTTTATTSISASSILSATAYIRPSILRMLTLKIQYTNIQESDVYISNIRMNTGPHSTPHLLYVSSVPEGPTQLCIYTPDRLTVTAPAPIWRLHPEESITDSIHISSSCPCLATAQPGSGYKFEIKTASIDIHINEEATVTYNNTTTTPSAPPTSSSYVNILSFNNQGEFEILPDEESRTRTESLVQETRSSTFSGSLVTQTDSIDDLGL